MHSSERHIIYNKVLPKSLECLSLNQVDWGLLHEEPIQSMYQKDNLDIAKTLRKKGVIRRRKMVVSSQRIQKGEKSRAYRKKQEIVQRFTEDALEQRKLMEIALRDCRVRRCP